jgi:hypothetical protein
MSYFTLHLSVVLLVVLPLHMAPFASGYFVAWKDRDNEELTIGVLRAMKDCKTYSMAAIWLQVGTIPVWYRIMLTVSINTAAAS